MSAVMRWTWAAIQPDQSGSKGNCLIVSVGCSRSSKQPTVLACHFTLDWANGIKRVSWAKPTRTASPPLVHILSLSPPNSYFTSIHVTLFPQIQLYIPVSSQWGQRSSSTFLSSPPKSDCLANPWAQSWSPRQTVLERLTNPGLGHKGSRPCSVT